MRSLVSKPRVPTLTVPCAVARVSAALVFAALLAAGPMVAQSPCVEPDNGSGTVTLPPEGCEYLSPSQVHMIIDGLPPGTTIILKPIHLNIICRELGQCGDGTTTGKGSLGGEIERAQSDLELHMSGTGALAGFQRILTVPARFETHTAPRNLGARTQTFGTAMWSLEGEILGDSDFSVLRIEAGEAFGLPSPGSTTLTRQSDGSFVVDSKFEIHYRITFQGDPNGRLRGFGGTTESSVDMVAFDAQ
jgi:hypothetical protein